VVVWDDLWSATLVTGLLMLVSLAPFVVSAVGVLSALLARRVGMPVAIEWRLIGGPLVVAMPVSFAGIVTGFLTGLSRSPVIVAVVPALLTLVGLVVVYLAGEGKSRAMIAGVALFLFAADVLVGSVLGSASRARHDELMASVAVQKLRAEQEFAVRLYGPPWVSRRRHPRR
jgi:hypothetical protein